MENVSVSPKFLKQKCGEISSFFAMIGSLNYMLILYCRLKTPAESMKSGIVVYSNGWPLGHQETPSTFCSQQIDTGSYSETTIVIMDLDLKRNSLSQCNSSNQTVEILREFIILLLTRNPSEFSNLAENLR